MYIFFPYIIILIISFTMLIVLSIYGYKFRENIGVKEFIFSMIVCAWWVLCQAFELMAIDFMVKYSWATIEYLGAGLATFAYLSLTLRFTGRGKWLTKRNIIIVLSIYVLFYFCVFTDMQFGLMRTNFELDTSAIPYVINKSYGPVFPIYILFTYSMNVCSIVILLISIIKKDNLYKKQATALLIAIFIISSFNIAYITGVFGDTRFDYAPAVFGVATSFLFIGIFRHKLLNIIPISRDMLVDKMDNGLVVIDKNNLIVDSNSVFNKMFNMESSDIIGTNIKEIKVFQEIIDVNAGQNIIDFESDKKYKLKIKSYVLDKNNLNSGMMYIIEDMTIQHEYNEKILEQQKLISVMNEREKFARDLHDSFGQVFAYVNVQAQTIKEYLRQGQIDNASKKLDELICVSKDSHAEIREYILQMKGFNWKNRNFRVALNQYVMDQCEKYKMKISVIYDDDLPGGFPNEEKAPEIIRIIQECLNNVRKHAGECSVTINFKNLKNEVSITIYDDGCGFDTKKTVTDGGYGLSIMKERANDIRCKLNIKSTMGVGTAVELILHKEVNDENTNCR